VKPKPVARGRVAVLIPCFNEAITVERVVRDFREQLPAADIYVYDNNSTDDTAEAARRGGAIVRHECRQGKGFVLQAMFRDIDACYYVLVDGDGTYPADQVKKLLGETMYGKADMTVGTRLAQHEERSFRPFHVLGNQLVRQAINWIFGANLSDVMSGYRVFSRRFVLEVPLVSKGFEIETELTLQALYRGMVIREVPILYGTRPAGSQSKLSTVRDGIRVLVKIVNIFKAYRPLLFFGLLGMAACGAGLALGSAPVIEFFATGRINRFPTAILAASLEIVGMVLGTCGIILDSVNHHFKELSRLVLMQRLDRDVPVNEESFSGIPEDNSKARVA
jgi:glycosyltransferase involved in cell wall biosynthesis